MKTRNWTKKRTKKRTTGSSSRFVAVAALLTLLSVHALSGKKKEKPAAESFAVIAGTTYRPPGLSLPGARVRVRPEPTADASQAKKLKGAEVVTDSRGEFAIRVPAVPAKWVVNVQASGYQPQSKSVATEGEQRLELSFVLEPEMKK